MNSWSVADKKKLLMALQKHGVNDMLAIKRALPEKTVTEIRFAFEKYSKMAQSKCHQEEKMREEDSPINQWIKILKKTHLTSNAVLDVIPRALKYIALYERRVPDRDVNLSDCYTVLSEISNGRPSKALDPKTAHFFYGKLSTLAMAMGKMENARKKDFIRSINTYDQINKPQIIKTYNRKKQINGILNPLNVPSELLKFQEDDA